MQLSKQQIAQAILAKRKAVAPCPFVIVVDGPENVEAEQRRVCDRYAVEKDSFFTVVLSKLGDEVEAGAAHG